LPGDPGLAGQLIKMVICFLFSVFGKKPRQMNAVTENGKQETENRYF
jgi:hypothetical protein